MENKRMNNSGLGLTEYESNSYIEDNIEKIKGDSEYINRIVFNTVNEYSEPLDNIMLEVERDIINVDQPALSILEKYFLELANCLYFMGDRLEKLGVLDYVSKQSYKESYNNYYLDMSNPPSDVKKKPTVAEITASAENNSLYQCVVNNIYSRAYKVFKNKIDYATTMLNSISKIISRRMTEMQMNSITPTGKQILNEDF